MKQIRFAHHLPLRGRNITTALISNSIRVVAAECARPCVDLDACVSFFYNTATGECQYHDVVFTTSAGATDKEGVEYYYIIEGRNTWCPVEKGFQLLTEDGPCVKFHTDRKTWNDANETCVSYAPFSHLVILDNQEKNELVKAAATAFSAQITHGVGIGLREYVTDAYRWVSGQAVDFTDWGANDLSRIDQEDCVYLIPADGWRWGITMCVVYGHYICEVDIKQYDKMMNNN